MYRVIQSVTQNAWAEAVKHLILGTIQLASV